jgi:hypothetical protein
MELSRLLSAECAPCYCKLLTQHRFQALPNIRDMKQIHWGDWLAQLVG